MPGRHRQIEWGKRYNRLTVLQDMRGWRGNRKVYARCECGTVRPYFLKNLKNGNTKSCGCYRTDRALCGVKNEKGKPWIFMEKMARLSA